jgi:oxygen-independent coproporphyrinogen-3 oxidase
MNRRTHPGLYIHVPFCVSKCVYCDFYSETCLSDVSAWLTALGREMLLYRDLFPAFDTLYVGGGTPTVLGEDQLGRLFEMACRSFAFTDDPEITVEANPNDITAGKLAVLRECGVNRISLGVQSFDDHELAFLQRRHTAREAEQALELIGRSGIATLGVDLIYGIPGQTMEGWINTLEHAIAFRPAHVSCYQLTVAGGTPLHDMQGRGAVRMPGEDEGECLFLATAQCLEKAGYVHYEISNYARGETNVSRHNSKYWRHVPYLGLGPAAHSFKDGRRWWNRRSVTGYCGALGEGRTPVIGEEVLTSEQLELESLCLGLRTTGGVERALLSSTSRRRALLDELLRADYVKLQGQKVVSTTKGFLVADRLAAALS